MYNKEDRAVANDRFRAIMNQIKSRSERRKKCLKE